MGLMSVILKQIEKKSNMLEITIIKIEIEGVVRYYHYNYAYCIMLHYRRLTDITSLTEGVFANLTHLRSL